MPNDNIDGAAEAALENDIELEDLSALAEGDEGEGNLESASPVLPDFTLQELSEAELNAVLEQALSGKPAEATETEDGEAPKEKDSQKEPAKKVDDEDGDFTKLKRLQVAHYAPEDKTRIVRINDLTRGGLSLEEAIARTAPTVAKATEAAKTDEPAPQAQPTGELAQAESALEAAEAALIEAQTTYDTEAIAKAQKAVNVANRKLATAEVLAQMADINAQQQQETVTQQAQAEVSRIAGAIPEFADPDSLLSLQYDRLLSRAKDEDLGPGSVERLAREAWGKVNPGKAFPIGAKAQPATLIHPKKSGVSVEAALTATGRAPQQKTLAALRTPGAERNLSDAELDAMLARLP